MKYLFLAFLTIVGSVMTTQAQSVTDVIDYGTLETGGTARTIAIGGAIGALGGDFGVVSTNPAGLAVYRTSEVVFSPSINLTNMDARLVNGNNESVSESKTQFQFNSLGLVFNSGGRNWKTSNVGIGFNRIANFQQQFSYDGLSSGTIVRRFLELATDALGNSVAPQNLNPYGAGLAYGAAALFDVTGDPNDEDYVWGTDFDGFEDADIIRSESFSRRGAINELSIAWAGNYKHKLMMGIALGVPFLRDSKERTYSERDPVAGELGNVPSFDNLEYFESLETKGIGFNLKLGLIYRVNQMFRLGAAVHTPTRYGVTDEYDTNLAYTYTLDGEVNGGFNEPESIRTFDYKIRTPWRVMGSAAAIIKKLGFVSAEVEWVNYGGSNFNLTDDSQDPANDEIFQEILNSRIRTNYKSALNIRLGGEYAYKKLRVRAGYAITGNPLALGSRKNNALSFGLGFRANTFYTDMSFRANKISGEYTPYELVNEADEQTVDTELRRNQIVLTFGYKF